jgi:hypothetical protein
MRLTTFVSKSAPGPVPRTIIIRVSDVVTAVARPRYPGTAVLALEKTREQIRDETTLAALRGSDPRVSCFKFDLRRYLTNGATGLSLTHGSDL